MYLDGVFVPIFSSICRNSLLMQKVKRTVDITDVL